MARDRIDGILNMIGLDKLLDQPIIPAENVNSRFSNSTGKNVEPFFAPNYINDVRTEQPTFKLSDLEGRGVLFPESDVTAHGVTLAGIGNQPLARPIDLNTGIDHIFYGDSLWKSDEGVVNKFLQRAEKLKKNTGGQDVFLLPYSGFGKSSDFYTGIGKAMINYNLANAPQSTVNQMDKMIASRIPAWRGSDHPDAMAIWEATPAGVRMELTNAIDRELRNQGSLSAGQARVATARQDQLGANQHAQLRNVGLLDVGAKFALNNNPDYNASMFGDPVGVLDQPITAYDLLQDRRTGSGRPLTSRSLQWSDTSKIITPEDLGKVVTDKDLRAAEDRGIKIDTPSTGPRPPTKPNPLAMFIGSMVTMAGMGYSGEEAEAAVLKGVVENTADIAGKIQKVEKKKETGEPLTEGDIMSGRGGQTFLTLEQESRARVYDEFRRQISEFDTPLFDTSEAGKVTIGDRGGVEGVSRYTFPEEYQGATTEVGVETPDLIEIKPTDEGAQLFREKILAGKEASKYGASVEAYDADAYKDMRLFLTEDGSAGYALKPDGDIVSAFSTGQYIGVGPHLIMHGIEQGGKKLDAFDTVLPNMYATMGMRETSRLAFDPTQAPPDWNEAVFGKYQGGRPDVSFMALDRDFATPVSPNMVDDYGEAVDLQNLAVGLLDSPTVRGSDPLSIMPAPQRFFDPESKAYKPFLQGDFERGGRYLSMGEGQRDVSGMYPDSASISISPDGKPSFQVSGQSATGLPATKGRQIKSNLFKKSAGWEWTEVPEGFDPNPDKSFSLVSVEDGSKHYYSLGSTYPEGVNLKRYPMSKDEPRLRPTMKGEVVLGNVVGQIEVRGKTHPVYDNVTVQPKGTSGAGKAVAGVATGILAAGASGESDASIVGQMSRLGASRADLKGMAIKMAAEGLSAEEIIQKTGWYQGPLDGKWRTEIPNTKTKMAFPEIPAGKSFVETSVGDVIDDDELLLQYDLDPKMKQARERELVYQFDEGVILDGEQTTGGSLSNIKVTIDNNIKENEGYYWQGGVDKDSFEYRPEEIVVSGLSSPSEQRATLLHELQHAIQARENFARGGGPEQFIDMAKLSLQFSGKGQKLARLAELEEAYLQKDAMGYPAIMLSEMNELQKLRTEKAQVDRYRAEVEKVGNNAPMDMYRNLGGEVEARNVENRDAVLSETGYRDISPLETESVLPERQLLRTTPDPLDTLDDDFYRVGQDTGLINRVMAENARGDALSSYGRAIDKRRKQLGSVSKMINKRLDSKGPLVGEIIARETENFTKLIVGLVPMIANPESTFYQDVTQSKSLLGDPSEGYNTVMDTIAKGMQTYVLEPAKKALEYKGSDDKSVKQEIAETIQPAIDAYKQLPEPVQEEVMPRLGYLGALVGSLYGFGLADKAKRAVGTRGEEGLLGKMYPLEGELVDIPPPAIDVRQPVGLLQ